MGQKVNPIGIRLGFIKKSNSFWYPETKPFAVILQDDFKIRKHIKETLSKNANISAILIERAGEKLKIIINTTKPGLIIGKKGEDIEILKKNLSDKYKAIVTINVEEIRNPELDAFLVAENIAMQLKKRVLFRKAMKKAVSNALKSGAKGIKIAVSGRVGGTDIARTEWYKEGRVPLHTFRADIDYGFAESLTVYGIIGVKVWIYKGDVNVKKHKMQNKENNNAST